MAIKGIGLKLSDLKEDPSNPRDISEPALSALSTSLDEFGDLSGIVWNKKTGELVCGHQRLKALKKRHGNELALKNGKIISTDGKEYPVRIVDWDRDKQQIANITANSNQISGVFTEEALKALNGIEVGFPELSADLKMDDLLRELEAGFDIEDGPEAGLTDPDDVPDAPEEAISNRGDLWIMGEHRLLCGDCTDAVDVARVMGGENAGLMNTDPPYGVNYVAGSGAGYDDIKNDELNGEELQKFLEDAIKTAVPHLIENPAFYLWHPMLTQGAFFAAAAAAAAEILIHRQIIWVKPSLILGHGDYHWKHELCFYGWIQGKRCVWYGDRSQTTTWEIGRENQKIHPTQKPVDLFTAPIMNHLKVGEIAYEPFSGSGSQIIAAEQLNRRCFAIEIEPKYVDVAVKRWEEFTGKKAVLDNG